MKNTNISVKKRQSYWVLLLALVLGSTWNIVEAQPATTKVNSYIGAYAIIRKVTTAIHNAFNNIKELDKTITSIAVVTNMSQQDLWNKVGQYT